VQLNDIPETSLKHKYVNNSFNDMSTKAQHMT